MKHFARFPAQLLCASLLLATVAARDSGEELDMPSGRKMYVVETLPRTAPFCLVAETTAIVIQNLGRPAIAVAYAKHCNLLFYTTSPGDFEQNDVAFDEALAFARQHFGVAPVVVTWSSSSNVALRGLARASAGAAKGLIYSSGPGFDVDAQLRQNVDWLKERLEGSSYAAIAPLVRMPKDALVPFVQFNINSIINSLYGGDNFGCMVTGVLCLEALSSISARETSFVPVLTNIHLDPVNTIFKLAGFANWYDGWATQVDDVDAVLDVGVQVMVLHGANDRHFDHELTNQSLSARVHPTPHACIVPHASHFVYTDNADGAEACIAQALALFAP